MQVYARSWRSRPKQNAKTHKKKYEIILPAGELPQLHPHTPYHTNQKSSATNCYRGGFAFRRLREDFRSVLGPPTVSIAAAAWEGRAAQWYKTHTRTHTDGREEKVIRIVRRRRVTVTASKVPERKIIHIQAVCYIYRYERIICNNMYAAAAALLTLADRRVNVLYQRCQRRRPKLEYICIYIILCLCIIAAQVYIIYYYNNRNTSRPPPTREPRRPNQQTRTCLSAPPLAGRRRRRSFFILYAYFASTSSFYYYYYYILYRIHLPTYLPIYLPTQCSVQCIHVYCCIYIFMYIYI